MKIVRFAHKGIAYYGVMDEGRIKGIEGSPYNGIVYTGVEYGVDDVKMLAPVEPEKIVAVGLNYKTHAYELKMDIPGDPLIFLKPPSSVLSPGSVIVHPSQSQQVDYEAELAVVIGKECKNVTEENAADYIFGFACLNDVTARDIQEAESQWTRAKGFDTFCPIGPFIETQYQWRGKRVRSVLNGEIRQDGNTDDLIHPVEKLVSFISNVMTLKPGDVIATGTPEGIGPMAAGDTVRIEIEGLGILENSVE